MSQQSNQDQQNVQEHPTLDNSRNSPLPTADSSQNHPISGASLDTVRYPDSIAQNQMASTSTSTSQIATAPLKTNGERLGYRAPNASAGSSSAGNENESSIDRIVEAEHPSLQVHRAPTFGSALSNSSQQRPQLTISASDFSLCNRSKGKGRAVKQDYYDPRELSQNEDVVNEKLRTMAISSQTSPAATRAAEEANLDIVHSPPNESALSPEDRAESQVRNDDGRIEKEKRNRAIDDFLTSFPGYDSSVGASSKSKESETNNDAGQEDTVRRAQDDIPVEPWTPAVPDYSRYRVESSAPCQYPSRSRLTAMEVTELGSDQAPNGPELLSEAPMPSDDVELSEASRSGVIDNRMEVIQEQSSENEDCSMITEPDGCDNQPLHDNPGMTVDTEWPMDTDWTMSEAGPPEYDDQITTTPTDQPMGGIVPTFSLPAQVVQQPPLPHYPQNPFTQPIRSVFLPPPLPSSQPQQLPVFRSALPPTPAILRPPSPPPMVPPAPSMPTSPPPPTALDIISNQPASPAEAITIVHSSEPPVSQLLGVAAHDAAYNSLEGPKEDPHQVEEESARQQTPPASADTLASTNEVDGREISPEGEQPAGEQAAQEDEEESRRKKMLDEYRRFHHQARDVRLIRKGHEPLRVVVMSSEDPLVMGTGAPGDFAVILPATEVVVDAGDKESTPDVETVSAPKVRNRSLSPSPSPPPAKRRRTVREEVQEGVEIVIVEKSSRKRSYDEMEEESESDISDRSSYEPGSATPSPPPRKLRKVHFGEPLQVTVIDETSPSIAGESRQANNQPTPRSALRAGRAQPEPILKESFSSSSEEMMKSSQLKKVKKAKAKKAPEGGQASKAKKKKVSEEERASKARRETEQEREEQAVQIRTVREDLNAKRTEDKAKFRRLCPSLASIARIFGLW